MIKIQDIYQFELSSYLTTLKCMSRHIFKKEAYILSTNFIASLKITKPQRRNCWSAKTFSFGYYFDLDTAVQQGSYLLSTPTQSKTD